MALRRQVVRAEFGQAGIDSIAAEGSDGQMKVLPFSLRVLSRLRRIEDRLQPRRQQWRELGHPTWVDQADADQV